MSIAERKEREKEEMRRNILRAALSLFRERGYDSVSIRNIADAIEYSPATIYLYFRDKSEIFAALQYEAASVMRNHFMPLLQLENPWERLVEFGRLYIDFGLKHSDLYDLIFIIRAPMEHVENQECWNVGMTTHQFFSETVQACVNARYFKSTDTETIAYTLWAYVHGVVALFVRDRMRMYPPEKREELARKSFAMFTKMIEVL